MERNDGNSLHKTRTRGSHLILLITIVLKNTNNGKFKYSYFSWIVTEWNSLSSDIVTL